jgi:hypothetical protein
MKDTNRVILYALRFLKANIDETTEEDLNMTEEEIIQKIKNYDFEKLKLINRLEFVQEDSKKLRDLLNKANVDLEFSDGDKTINTLLSNLEIASDLKDSEPETQKWKT